MRSLLGVVVVAIGVGTLFAQADPSKSKPSKPQRSNSQRSNSQPYVPAVPATPAVAVSGGGWGGEYHASTAAEGAMQGMASAVRAAGDYNLSTSAAAINMTQARSNQIQNAQQYTNAYFDMRRVNREATAAERSPRLNTEQLTRIAQAGVPKPLGTQQLDPVSGKLQWPLVLQSSSFAKQRGVLDAAFAKRAQYGALSLEDTQLVTETTQDVLEQLAGIISDVPTDEYIAAKKFVQSLAYQARKPA